MANPFEYIIKQDKTLVDLGFNEHLEKPLPISSSDQINADLLDAALDQGDFDSQLFKNVDANQLASLAIKNIKIKETFRAYTAVVSPVVEDKDFTNIQAAIDYVNTLGGGTVLIRAGTYLQTNNIQLYSNVHLIGEDQENTIIDFGTVNPWGLQIVGASGNNKKNVSLQNLQIRRNFLHSDRTVQIRWAENILVESCKFYDCQTQGQAAIQIHSDGTSNIYILNNVFDTCRGGVINVSSGGNVVISGNYLTNIVEWGIANFGGSDVFINDNYIKNCNRGILVTDATGQDCKRVVVTNNIIRDSTAASASDDAIRVSGGSATTQDIIVANNVVENWTASTGNVEGISINNLTRALIIRNTVRSCDSDGIKLDTADNCIVSKNITTLNSGYGINISNAACDNTIVTSNQASGNTTGSINDAGTGSTVANNEI